MIDLGKALQAERFLDELSLSVTKIIFASFPGLTSEEKEEIEQEIKLKLLKMAARGKKIGNFRSYVWKMVYSTALDVIANRSPAVSLEENAVETELIGQGPSSPGVATPKKTPLRAYIDNFTPELAYEVKELRTFVRKAVATLPQRRKSVVLLHIQGMSLEEIASFLGETKPTVRHLLYRGIDSLRKEFRNQAPERLGGS